MPPVFKDLLGSQKFIAISVLFMVPITVFTALHLMTIEAWRHDALWAIGFLISGHTLEGVAASIGQPRPASADQTTTAAAVTVNVPAPVAPASPQEPPPIRPGA